MTIPFRLYLPNSNPMWDYPELLRLSMNIVYFTGKCSSSWDVLQLLNDCLLKCGKFTLVRAGDESTCVADDPPGWRPNHEVLIDWKKMSDMEELEAFAVELWEKAVEVSNR